MATLTNYSSTKNNWLWTGVRNMNQLWTYVYIAEPILVSRIDVYWGGYDNPTSGRHFIARIDPSNHARLTGHIVYSSVISVPQGRGWRSASVPETLLEPGHYAVGIFADYLGRRTVGEWNGRWSNRVHYATGSNYQSVANGGTWNSGNNGCMPVLLVYESAGRVNLKVGNSWRKGQAHIKVNGSWRKAKAVWVRVNGVWRRSK